LDNKLSFRIDRGRAGPFQSHGLALPLVPKLLPI